MDSGSTFLLFVSRFFHFNHQNAGVTIAASAGHSELWKWKATKTSLISKGSPTGAARKLWPKRETPRVRPWLLCICILHTYCWLNMRPVKNGDLFIICYTYIGMPKKQTKKKNWSFFFGGRGTHTLKISISINIYTSIYLLCSDMLERERGREERGKYLPSSSAPAVTPKFLTR